MLSKFSVVERRQPDLCWSNRKCYLYRSMRRGQKYTLYTIHYTTVQRWLGYHANMGHPFRHRLPWRWRETLGWTGDHQHELAAP